MSLLLVQNVLYECLRFVIDPMFSLGNPPPAGDEAEGGEGLPGEEGGDSVESENKLAQDISSQTVTGQSINKVSFGWI